MSTVVIKSIDKGSVRQAMTDYAASLRQNHPEIMRIIWFGSWVTGQPTPGSDVEICLILESSELPVRERIPAYLPLGFPVGVDLFAYTESEFEQLRHASPGWYRAIDSGIDI